jgi:hypothetical protein
MHTDADPPTPRSMLSARYERLRTKVVERAPLAWKTATAQFERRRQWLLPRQQAVFVAAGVVVVLLLLIFGGVTAAVAAVAAWIALMRHFAQTEADRQRRITDTFSKAVEQLGSEKMEVRVGGIYTLERLAGEALTGPQADQGSGADLYWTVMETLTAFVRERAKWQEEPEAARTTMPAPSELWQSGPQHDARSLRLTPATDIAAVLTVIRRRSEAGRAREHERNWLFDLSAIDLRGANLIAAHLEYARLGLAHLELADLDWVRLEGADLFGAHLERAFLNGAHLEGTNLSDTHLEGAVLGGTHLEGAHFGGTHLERALLGGAHLDGANLSGAYLEGVDLSDAIGDAKTALPDGVARPAHWPAYEPD